MFDAPAAAGSLYNLSLDNRWFLFSVNGAKYQMQLFRFSPQFSCLAGEPLFCCGYHPQKMFCLSRLFFAGADFTFKVLSRNCIVRFAVIGANAGCCADELTDQPLGYGIPGNLLCESNRRLPKERRAFFQIIYNLIIARIISFS